MTSEFEDKPAVRSTVPLLLGLVGASGSGKTWSALRIATGMQRVIGGDIYVIDTEANRALQYADFFKFRHVPFAAPFNPLRYLAAFEHCVRRGAKIIVADSMTHEHSGDGGVLDMVEEYLDKKAGDNWEQREKYKWAAQIKPKAERKRLNNAIVQLGLSAVLCYRAVDRTKPGAGGKPKHEGWMPETTSTLHYEMTQRFLLTPGCDGKPSFFPEEDAEKRLVKNPAQFRDWFKAGVQLSEDIGQRMAEWAAGSTAPAPSTTKPGPSIATLLTDYAACRTADRLAELEAARSTIWKATSAPDKERLKQASEAAKGRVSAQAADASPESEEDLLREQAEGRLFDRGQRENAAAH